MFYVEERLIRVRLKDLKSKNIENIDNEKNSIYDYNTNMNIQPKYTDSLSDSKTKDNKRTNKIFKKIFFKSK